ncbi:hypothetical protein PYW08_011457 [Mythimna loreyi]|uniref:Uncharacterized protein n=1 Tax=Mythimna loreyi TaxID=667449 RepID=A0ACC2QJW7_9NEOP|nr:hypothetical protein PYW08_011457 [Mythimna loreyi]
MSFRNNGGVFVTCLRAYVYNSTAALAELSVLTACSSTTHSIIMKTFVCIAVVVACALAEPAPWAGRRDKRSYLEPYGALGLGAPLLPPAALLAAPAAIVHEPVLSVKKIVTVPELVSVRKVVSFPHVTRVAHYVAAPRVTRVTHYSAPRVAYSYAPAYSAGWW